MKLELRGFRHDSDRDGLIFLLENIPQQEYNIHVSESCYERVREASMELLTTAEIAEKWGISRRRVSLLCAEGRIQGAVQKSKMWLVPADAKKPEDPRRERKKATRD